jgi:hypothetical protein
MVFKDKSIKKELHFFHFPNRLDEMIRTGFRISPKYIKGGSMSRGKSPQGNSDSIGVESGGSLIRGGWIPLAGGLREERKGQNSKFTG